MSLGRPRWPKEDILYGSSITILHVKLSSGTMETWGVTDIFLIVFIVILEGKSSVQ
jgi:hypothetical protein